MKDESFKYQNISELRIGAGEANGSMPKMEYEKELEKLKIEYAEHSASFKLALTSCTVIGTISGISYPLFKRISNAPEYAPLTAGITAVVAFYVGADAIREKMRAWQTKKRIRRLEKELAGTDSSEAYFI